MKINHENAEGKWELPERLRFTPDALEANAQQQAEWASRTASPFGKLSPREFARSRAVIEVEQYKQQLQSLDKAIGEAITKGGEYDNLQTKRAMVVSQLAISYATLGRFDLAAEAETDPEKRQEYVGILEALNVDDAEDCDCSDPKGEIPHSRKSYDYVWNIKLGREVFLVKCSKCKFKNAKPDLPEELVKMRTHRAKVNRAMEGLSVKEMMVREREVGARLNDVLRQ